MHQCQGRPPSRALPQRHRADDGRRPHGARGRRRAGRRRHHRRGRQWSVRARRRPRGRRLGRHRDARHDRHPPPHVADRDAGLRRRLDPDAVLRLVLPRARQALPARGHPRRQRAGRVGVAGGGRHDHRRLVARTPDRRPRRRGGGRPRVRAGPVRAGVRQHPGGALGVDGRPGRAQLLRAAYRQRPARPPDRLRRHRRPVVPGAGGLRVRPRARPRRHDARGRLGGHQRRRHPAGARGRPDPTRRHLRARGVAHERQLSPHRGVRRLDLGVDRVRAERGAGLSAHLAGTPPRHPGLVVDGHQRLVERRPLHRDAHDAGRRPVARAPRGARGR